MDVEALKIDRSGRSAKATRARSARSPWFGRGVALVVLLGLGWLFRAPIQGVVDAIRLPQVRILQVVRSHPATAGAVRGTAANGHIVAARRAALSADTAGRIIELNVTEGSHVKKGFVVARLYSRGVRRRAAPGRG